MGITSKKLEWDSNFFGFLVEKIDWSKDENQEDLHMLLVKSDARLLYVESESLIPHNEKFSYAGTKVIYQKEILSRTSGENKYVFSINAETYALYLKELRSLAYTSGEFSRFFLDSNFQRRAFEKLYNIWIENAHLKVSDNVFKVFQEGNGFPIGLLTAKIDADTKTCRVGLFAVSKTHQGKGIGTQLLESLETDCLDQNIGTVLIPTQLENKLACKFYSKMGYAQKNIKYIYHFWK